MAVDYQVTTKYTSSYSNTKGLIDSLCQHDCTGDGTCPYSLVEDIPLCARENNHITCVYDVVNTSAETRILSATTTAITYMKVDGNPLEAPKTGYTFDTEGEHTVKFYYNGHQLTRIFDGCNRLVKCYLSKNIDELWYLALSSGISNLKELDVQYITKASGFRALGAAGTKYKILNFERLKTVTTDTLTLTNSNLETLILGPNLTNISANFAYMASGQPSPKLKNVVIKAKTPPNMPAPTGPGVKSVFLTYVDFKGTIWVPAESLEAYKTHPTWGVWADHMKPIKWEDAEKW